MEQRDLDLMRPTVFRVEGSVSLATEVMVLVTPEDVADHIRHGGRKLAEKWTPERFMEYVAEQIAEEAAGPTSEWMEDFPASFIPWREEVGDDPAAFIKDAGAIWKGDGAVATVEDLTETRVDKYGRPLPPPPIPGQEQLAV